MTWRDDEGLTDPATAPRGARLAGPRVAWGIGDSSRGPVPLVWHWCDYSVWRARTEADPETYLAEYIPEPHWSPAGVGAHDLVRLDPLHLEPSLFWPSCCGLHGFLREGRWTDA